MAKFQSNKEAGYTLIEVMVAVSIFLVVMIIATGATTSIFEAERKARTIRSSLGNINVALEAMAKEARFGKDYNCGSTGNLAVPRNCSSGGSQLNFLSSDNVTTSYRKNGTTIERATADGFIAVTAPNVLIDDLIFYVLGAESSDDIQPKVLVKISGHAGAGKSRTDFTLQTLVSQRELDI